VIVRESAVPEVARDFVTFVGLIPLALRSFTTISVLCLSKILFFEVERVFTLGMLTVRTRLFEEFNFETTLFSELVPFEVIFATDLENPIVLLVVRFV
jgi:hypothetical protein